MAGMVTMVVDGIVPFILISILNTLIIRAIQRRHRELETFSEANSGSGSSRNIDPGKWTRPKVTLCQQLKTVNNEHS